MCMTKHNYKKMKVTIVKSFTSPAVRLNKKLKASEIHFLNDDDLIRKV